jgi:uncharacterized protein with HEPN domain
MSTPRTETAYLGDMLQYARRAHEKTRGITIDDWNADENVRLAVAYLIQIVGEAASRLSETTRAALPHLPWQDMIGMRHRLVHGYGHIVFSIVWKTATEALPTLIDALEQIVPPEP